jgi:hypothetical protein
VPDQDALTVAWTEDHQGPDAHSEIEIHHNLAKHRLGCGRNGVRSVQSDVGHMMAAWLRPRMSGKAGRG